MYLIRGPNGSVDPIAVDPLDSWNSSKETIGHDRRRDFLVLVFFVDFDAATSSVVIVDPLFPDTRTCGHVVRAPCHRQAGYKFVTSKRHRD